jgi:hypothetical protein
LLEEIAVTKTFLMATIRVVIGLLVWPFAAHAHNHSLRVSQIPGHSFQ